jgi:hypothetical protein
VKAGYLSEYFTGIAAKHLSAVEADAARSHQHEFNGVGGLKKIFGETVGKTTYKAKFIYLTDDDEPVLSDGSVTWYDAREKHPTRSEHRLYFPTTTVSECATEGDLLVIGRRPDDTILVVVAEKATTIANQVQWLFGLTDLDHPGFSVREELETGRDRIEFASRFILESIGVEVESTEETFLEKMIEMFSGTFPATRDFSAYARSTLKDISPREDPDAAIMAWMDREEVLFRTLEKHLIADRLAKGFDNDTDGFVAFSLSVQNRRKSRVGFALENHLEQVFVECGIRYARAAVTENRSKPDFLFPGSREYHDPAFDPVRLTMLGVKSTCKDRWRQVLSEAARIERKHLLTLEAAISISQTDEMQSQKLQLVLPRAIHSTYLPQQQAWLMNLACFMDLVRGRQVA